MLVAYRRLPRIVAMHLAMPDAIRLVDEHMIHRDREIDIERRMPGVGIQVMGNAERRGARVAEAEHIDARIAHVTEIEAQITIAQKIAPIGGGYALDDMLRAVLVDLEQPYWRPPFVVALEFDSCNILLARYLSRMRMSHHTRQQQPRPP